MIERTKIIQLEYVCVLEEKRNNSREKMYPEMYNYIKFP